MNEVHTSYLSGESHPVWLVDMEEWDMQIDWLISVCSEAGSSCNLDNPREFIQNNLRQIWELVDAGLQTHEDSGLRSWWQVHRTKLISDVEEFAQKLSDDGNHRD